MSASAPQPRFNRRDRATSAVSGLQRRCLELYAAWLALSWTLSILSTSLGSMRESDSGQWSAVSVNYYDSNGVCRALAGSWVRGALVQACGWRSHRPMSMGRCTPRRLGWSLAATWRLGEMVSRVAAGCCCAEAGGANAVPGSTLGASSKKSRDGARLFLPQFRDVRPGQPVSSLRQRSLPPPSRCLRPQPGVGSRSRRRRRPSPLAPRSDRCSARRAGRTA